MCLDTRVCDCACMWVSLSLSLSPSLSLPLFLSFCLCAIARVHVCVCAHACKPQKSPINPQQEPCTSDICVCAKRYLPKSPFSQHKITTHLQKREKHFWRTEMRKQPDIPAKRALHVRQKISIHLQKREKHFWRAKKRKNPDIPAKRALHVRRRERQLWCMDIRKRYPPKIPAKEPSTPSKEPYISAKREKRVWNMAHRNRTLYSRKRALCICKRQRSSSDTKRMMSRFLWRVLYTCKRERSISFFAKEPYKRDYILQKRPVI